MAVRINERIPANDEEVFRTMFDANSNALRVAVPGIIQSFDASTQTATVQPAIRERVFNGGGDPEWVNLPLLLDVPVVIPRAGGFALTLPVQKGDECLVIFADMCMDAWFSNGGIQNQIEKRRHDLSDGIAIVGLWSQPRKIANYSMAAAQLRTDDGSAYISLSNNKINIVAPTVEINGINFNTHTHTAPNGGGKTSGPS